MRIYLFIFFFLGASLNSFSQACSAAPDTRTLTQVFYKNTDKLLVFSCKVISSDITQSGEAFSIADVKEIYFGKTNLKKVRLYTGNFEPPIPPFFLRPQPQPKKQENRKDYNMDYVLTDDDGYTHNGRNRYGGVKMSVDSFYIIYTTNDTSYNQNYMWLSKPLKQTAAIKKEIEILKTFASIFNKKKSGHFIFKDYNNNIMAEGNYKKGKPNGIWKNFDEKGILISLESYKKNIYNSYYLNGNLSSTITTYKDSTVTKNYVDKPMLQFSFKTITIKNDSGYCEIYSTFNKEGGIIAKRTALAVYGKNGRDIYGKGLHGNCQDFYPNGQLKLNAQYLLNRRVGCWTWYNEDGTFNAEWDYNDGKAPQ